MHFVVLLVALFLLILGPQLWVKQVLARYSRKEEDFPGTAGELARHLLDRFELQEVKVEAAEGAGDHYDPISKSVRLTADKLNSKTLTAITTAAHEVGHAIQHHEGYPPFQMRLKLAKFAVVAERIGSFLLFAAPILSIATRSHAAGLLMMFAAFSTIGIGLLVNLVTLPVEWDASFSRAMPILEAGYVKPKQSKAARRILKACAMTYFASSLAGLLNFWRWMRVLRP